MRASGQEGIRIVRDTSRGVRIKLRGGGGDGRIVPATSRRSPGGTGLARNGATGASVARDAAGSARGAVGGRTSGDSIAGLGRRRRTADNCTTCRT
jgi:hypothetical protein